MLHVSLQASPPRALERRRPGRLKTWIRWRSSHVGCHHAAQGNGQAAAQQQQQQGGAGPQLLLGHFCSIVTCLALSPDGVHLASTDKDHKVRVSALPRRPLQVWGPESLVVILLHRLSRVSGLLGFGTPTGRWLAVRFPGSCMHRGTTQDVPWNPRSAPAV